MGNTFIQKLFICTVLKPIGLYDAENNPLKVACFAENNPLKVAKIII